MKQLPIKKIIVFGIGGIFIIACVTLVLHQYNLKSFEESEQFQAAKRFILNNEEINREAGGIIKIGEDFGGSINQETARIVISVKGNIHSFDVYCELIPVDEKWNVTSFEILK